MVFVADGLSAWLIFILAEAGRRRLTGWVLGSEQERELRSAAKAAVQLTATEVRPEGGERAEELARVVNEVFGGPMPNAPLAEYGTLLEALQAGIARQLDPLDNPGLTETGQSSAELLGVSVAALADVLFGHLLREIVVRGARGGSLAPLAAQLNNDVTHLQGRLLEGMVGRLTEEVREALGRLDVGPWAGWDVAAIGQLGEGPRGADLLDELLYGVTPAGEPPNSRRVDIYEIGVARSNYAENAKDPYIRRLDADSELDALLRTADPGRIILVVGPAKSGKSRTAMEAARRLDVTLLAPKAGALHRLALLTIPALAEDRPIMLWLDDLERYLTGAGRLSRSVLVRLSRAFPGLIVLATLTSARYQALMEEPPEIVSPASAAAAEDKQVPPARLGSDDPEIRALLDGARVVYLPADFVDSSERRQARRLYPQETFPRGPGVQFVAAREHDRFFATCPEANPVGWAIIMAAIDWGRVGLARPVPGSVLRSLSVHYLPLSGHDAFPSSERFDEALRWVQERPLASPVKALTQVSDGDDPSYVTFDYLSECADGRGPHRVLQIPSAVWRFAIEHAEIDEILTVVSASERRGGGVDVLARAAERLQASDRREPAVAGQLVGGVLLARRGELTAARRVFEEVASTDAGASAVVALTNLGSLAEREGDWENASTLYYRAARSGSVLANFRLGRLFELRGMLPDAVQHYRAAANGGSAEAMAALGGISRWAADPAEAKRWYTDAARAGLPSAMRTLAGRAEDDGDQAEAADWLRRAAAAGDTYAMRHLAKRAQGRGDADTALAWVMRAAEAGDPEAMKDAGDQARTDGDIAAACTWYGKAGQLDSPAIYELAELAAAGEQDALQELTRLASRSHVAAIQLGQLWARNNALEAAARWYRAAAEMGDSVGLRDLAVLAFRGSTHAVDSLTALAGGGYEAAASWLGAAAEEGSDAAEGALRDLCNEGHDEAGRQLTRALFARHGEAAALQWSRAAAESGAKWAMIQTAELLIKTGDRIGAVTWYERAGEEESGTVVHNLVVLAAEGMAEARRTLSTIADAGSAAAALALGQLCESDDVRAAVGWYKTAARTHNRQAAMRLAQLAADETAARDGLHDLADQGDPLSATLLGYLFLDQDENKAQIWLGKAARSGEPQAMIQLGHAAETRHEFDDATTWYRRAAQLRYRPAMVAYGRMLERDGNIDRAVDWYRQATDQSPDPWPWPWPYDQSEQTGEHELERLAATGHKAARFALAYLRREIWRIA